ncbi:MAG: hypothetical protein PWP14_1788 [Methanolobus sp.]|nr:hypothetical protein [Methanolobus sp.]
MESMRYMSLIFRGLVEEYNNSGVRPSVFMDAGGNLQVYLCDPIIEENKDYGIDVESDYDVNGAQFSESYTALMAIPTVSAESEINLEFKRRSLSKSI